MTTASNIDVLTDDEARLLTTLVSAGSEQTLLYKTLVTIGNKAAFTVNQVLIFCIHSLSLYLLYSYNYWLIDLHKFLLYLLTCSC